MTGATAAQIIPSILPTTSALTIYQRTPNWLIPRLDGPISPLSRFAQRFLPPIRWRIRASMMDFREAFHESVTDSDSASAQAIREMCETMLKSQIPDRPDLWEKLLPGYAPGCKRVVITDDYYPAVADPKTTLETGRIVRVVEGGVEAEDGKGGTAVHEHDLLVLATGFRTVEFLHPLKVTGTGGRSLGEMWKDGASALYGVTVPGLPNFGMFYGPNTNLGHNSIILMIEAQSRYLNGLVEAVLDARGKGKPIGLVPVKERTEAFNEGIQGVLSKSSFADPACNSWYKNGEGKITNNWSGTVEEYKARTARFEPAEYEIVRARQPAAA